MTKAKKTTTQPAHEKGFFELAGEAMTVLGHNVLEGKDKLVEVASEKFTDVKKAIKKKFAKKKAVVKKAAKKTVKKVVIKKSEVVNKPVKKVAPKKKKK
jgi:hypothetical protein